VLELTVAPAGGNEVPSVIQEHAKHIADLHGRSIAFDDRRPLLQAKARDRASAAPNVELKREPKRRESGVWTRRIRMHC
jgi:hypothetical protein